MLGSLNIYNDQERDAWNSSFAMTFKREMDDKLNK